jgi:bifunctional enzyme CysN/CysC
VLDAFEQREERLRRLGELARILTDSGQIFITSLTDLDPNDRELLHSLNAPNEILFVNVGMETRIGGAESIEVSLGEEIATTVDRIGFLLKRKDIIPDYHI